MTVRRNMPGAQEQKNNSTVACDKVRIMSASEKADINDAEAVTASTDMTEGLSMCNRAGQ